MTIEKFDWLVQQAQLQGKYRGKQFISGFGADEEEEVSFELDGFIVYYRNNRFYWMTDLNGNVIRRDDCTESDMTNIESMNDEQLALLIKDAQKIMKRRQVEQATKAIEKFNQAWNELKKYGEVRVRVNVTGEKHFHTTVNKLELDFLPFI